MRYLPPRRGPGSEAGLDPDFDDSLSAVAREVCSLGDAALRDVRTRTLESWIAAGAAWEVLQLAAMHRSNSNAPAGRRYNIAFAILGHPWPELAKIDKTSRKDAIWLFKNSDEIRLWLAAFPQNRRDRWAHPTVIRQNYQKQRPALKNTPAALYKPRPPRQSRKPPANPLSRAALTREELEAHIEDLERDISDRDRTIIDLNEMIEAQRSRIAELESDKAWLKAEVRQLQGIVTPPVAAEEAHESREVVPPMRFDKPHYAGWARQMAEAITAATSVDELQWLRDDNREHIDAFETETPGAGRGIERRIDERILRLQ